MMKTMTPQDKITLKKLNFMVDYRSFIPIIGVLMVVLSFILTIVVSQTIYSFETSYTQGPFFITLFSLIYAASVVVMDLGAYRILKIDNILSQSFSSEVMKAFKKKHKITPHQLKAYI